MKRLYQYLLDAEQKRISFILASSAIPEHLVGSLEALDIACNNPRVRVLSLAICIMEGR